MRIKLALLVVGLTILACTANVTPLNTTPSSTPAIPPQTIVEATQVPPTSASESQSSSTATANPTEVFVETKSALSTDTVVPPKDSGTSPIRFAPNGTYVDVLDSIPAGTSKTYSVHALRGQIMSVSVHQGSNENWTVIPIKVRGADGTTLCPAKPDMSCYFWRGALPATQDYFVTLIPDISVSDFMLRVAINPPDTATQSFIYESHDRHVMFQYSDEFAPVRLSDAPVSKFMPEIALQFIDSTFYANTNLDEAYFLYGSTTDPSIVASCTQPQVAGGPETVIGHVNLSGVDFVHSEGEGVGAGNIYDVTNYRAVYNNACYEITFFIHSGNIGNYDPSSGIKEFDYDTLLQKFEAILSTLVIK